MAAMETEDGARLPQPTEEVHLPPPSYLPVLFAAGTAIILVGIVLHWAMVVVGLIIALWVFVRWLRVARHEMRQLPVEH
jgi:Flp pilus assembly protein TadB